MYVRKDGPTPNGGAYSIAYFADEGRGSHGGTVRPVHIHEYSADGECVHWVSGYSMSVGPAEPVGPAGSRYPSLLAGVPWYAKAGAAVVLFALFSIAGWLYETVENVFTFGGFYLRASLMLPWCPIYGIGGLVIVVVLEPVRRRLAPRVPRVVQVIAITAGIYALTTAVELAGSYACEAVMGYVPWDYSAAPLNFQGRIAPMYTLRFVVLGLVALYALYPLVARWARTHGRAVCIAAVAILALFAIDGALQLAGVWTPVKDALVPFGINHW